MEQPTRRMFAAIVPPLAMREELARRLAATPDIRWTPPENMHVTLVFDPACADVPGMADHLSAATEGCPAFRMRIGGAGSFHARRGSTLWLAARGSADPDQAALRALLMAVGARADAVGHLTLARVREPGAGLAAIDALPTLEWLVEEVVLFESTLATAPGERSRHTVVARFPLAPGTASAASVHSGSSVPT